MNTGPTGEGSRRSVVPGARHGHGFRVRCRAGSRKDGAGPFCRPLQASCMSWWRVPH